jgi:hypothetical protein
MQSSKKEDKQEARTEFAIPAERRGGEERWDSTPPKFPALQRATATFLYARHGYQRATIA